MIQCVKLGKAKEKALRIISNPELWPTRPVLHVKKRNRWEPTLSTLSGVLLDPESVNAPQDCKYSVYLCSSASLPKAMRDYNRFTKQIYRSYEEMVADGWVLE